MNKLITCASCLNKVSKDNLNKGDFYCSLVKDVIPDGIVNYTTDASECIKKRLFKPQEK